MRIFAEQRKLLVGLMLKVDRQFVVPMPKPGEGSGTRTSWTSFAAFR